MLINSRLLLLGFIAFSFSLPAPSALAQNAGGTQIEEVPEEAISIFSRDHYQVEFLDAPDDSISKFTMRLSSFGQLSGCASMTKPIVETKSTAQAIAVEVVDSEIKLDNKKPRYTNYDCKIKQNRSFFDVVLDRDELIENNIKEIKLTSVEYGDFTTSEIDVNEERFILKVKTYYGDLFIKYFFFPKNTVILSTPFAKSGQSSVELLKEYARLQGLKAADDHFEDYILPHHKEHEIAFVDRWNRIMPLIDNPDETQVIGQVTAYRRVYGVNGPVDEPYDLDVYASVPKQSAVLIKK